MTELMMESLAHKANVPGNGQPFPQGSIIMKLQWKPNIRMLINRGRGYKNLRYLLLKAKRMAVTNVEFLAVHRVPKVA